VTAALYVTQEVFDLSCATLDRRCASSLKKSAGEEVVRIVQSMRAGSFADVSVLGTQYRDRSGGDHWYFAVWSEQDITVRIYRASCGELPEQLESAHREALMKAIELWESSPVSQPN
jgi:hypothetical protein